MPFSLPSAREILQRRGGSSGASSSISLPSARDILKRGPSRPSAPMAKGPTRFAEAELSLPRSQRRAPINVSSPATEKKRTEEAALARARAQFRTMQPEARQAELMALSKQGIKRGTFNRKLFEVLAREVNAPVEGASFGDFLRNPAGSLAAGVASTVNATFEGEPPVSGPASAGDLAKDTGKVLKPFVKEATIGIPARLFGGAAAELQEDKKVDFPGYGPVSAFSERLGEQGPLALLDALDPLIVGGLAKSGLRTAKGVKAAGNVKGMTLMRAIEEAREAEKVAKTAQKAEQAAKTAKLRAGAIDTRKIRGKQILAERAAEKAAEIAKQTAPTASEVGITSFRGKPVKTVKETKPYFNTTRAKGFENSLNKKSADYGVTAKPKKAAGVWQGDIEPSFTVKAKGTYNSIKAYAAEHGKLGNQDAVVLFQADKAGKANKITLSGIKNVDAVLKKLNRVGIDGATVVGRSVVIYGESPSKLPKLAKNVKMTVTKGNLEFLEKANYDEVLKGYKAQQTVRGRGGIRTDVSPQKPGQKPAPVQTRPRPKRASRLEEPSASAKATTKPVAGTRRFDPVTAQATAKSATAELKTARAAEAQAGRIPVPQAKAPNVATLEEAGATVTTTARRPLKSVFAPMREIFRADRVAGKIGSNVRRAEKEFSVAVARGQDTLNKAFKGFSRKEREAFGKLYNEGKLTPEVLKKMPKKYQEAGRAIREMNREIRRIAQDEFGIDTSKWRFDEGNYFHHMFRGDHVVRHGDEIIGVFSKKDALKKADSLIQGGADAKKVSVGPRFEERLLPSQLAGQKGFAQFAKRLSQRLEISGDDVIAELASLERTVGRGKLGAFRQRAKNLAGYETDPVEVYSKLWYQVSKRHHLDPTIDAAFKEVGKLKQPWMRQEVRKYLEAVGKLNYDPLVLDHMLAFATRVGAIMKLGYRPSTAMINRLQGLQTSFSELGHYYFRGEAMLLRGKAKDIVDKLLIEAQPTKAEVGFAGRKVPGKPSILHPLRMFHGSEGQVRKATGVGAYLKGKAKGMSDAKATQYALDVIDSTMYDYSLADAPIFYRNSLGRNIGQFKRFQLNYLFNLKNTLTGKPLGAMERYPKLSKGENVGRALRFIAGNTTVGGIRAFRFGFKATLLYGALDHSGLGRGILSMAGIDLSGRAGADDPFSLIPEPERFNDSWTRFLKILGPTASDVGTILNQVNKYRKSRDLDDLVKATRINPALWNAYQFIKSDEEAVEITRWEKTLIGTGVPSVKSSISREGLEHLNYFGDENRTVNGFPTEKALQNMTYNLGRDGYDDQKKKVIRVMFRELGISESRQAQLLRDRKERMKR